MELPHIGKHCHLSGCKQIDFLPFECNLCKHYYCKEHWKYADHNCQSISERKDKYVPVCPICNSAVPVGPRDDINVVMDRHIASGCKYERELQKKDTARRKCNFPGCKKSELVPIKCFHCNKIYCMSHRVAEVHKCKVNEKKANVSQVGPFIVSIPPTGQNTQEPAPLVKPSTVKQIKVK